MKVFVYLVNAHQRKTHSVNTSATFPGHSCHYPMGSMNKVAMVAGILSNLDFHSPKPSRLWPLLSAQYSSIPWGGHPAPRWQVDYIGPLLSWKGQHFVLTGIDSYSGYRFSFPNASAKTAINGLIECPTYCHGIPYSIASDQETHFTAKEGQ